MVRTNPKPDYPRIARRRGLQGLVLLLLRVDTAGRVTSATLERSSGHASLDRAAEETVRTWLFHPARWGQTPVIGELLVPVRFELVEAG